LEPPTAAYNCVAWSLGVTDEWWWFDPIDKAPFGNDNRVVEQAEMDAFYASHGFVVTPNMEEAEIMLYRNAEGLSHVARKMGLGCQCGAGHWIMFSSKDGSFDRLEHRRDQLNGGIHGNHYRYYKQQ